jgi:hypothetical protein
LTIRNSNLHRWSFVVRRLSFVLCRCQ